MSSDLDRDDWWDEACKWRWRSVVAMTLFAVFFVAGKSGLRHLVNPWWFYGLAITVLLFSINAFILFLVIGSRAKRLAARKPLTGRERRL